MSVYQSSTKTFVSGLAIMVFSFLSGKAFSGELSMISGVFQQESTKVEPSNTKISESVITLGARYAEPISDVLHWFVQPKLQINSYSGNSAPDNHTGIAILGGVRHYFPGFSTSVTPYLEGSGGYQSKKTVLWSNTGSSSQIENSGLYYLGSTGFRFALSKDFFMDLDANLFESALFATQKTTSSSGEVTKQSKTELFASSMGLAFAKTSIGIGIRF